MPARSTHTVNNNETDQLDLYTLFQSDEDEGQEFLGFDLQAENQVQAYIELGLIFSTTGTEEEFTGFTDLDNTPSTPNLSSVFLDDSNLNEFFGF